MNLRAHLSLACVVVWAGSFSAITSRLEDGVAAGDVAFWRYAVAAPGFAFVGESGSCRRGTALSDATV